MVKAAYLFSGQGQQFAGMGQDFYKTEPAYRALVDEASQILDQDFTDPAVMDDPVNTQLAIVIFSLGVERILRQEKLRAEKFVGLSLGEYSALLAAGSFSLADGLAVIGDRARYMSEAGKQNPGQMVAVLNAEPSVIDEALADAREVGDVFPANYNTPKQTVFGGNAEGIERFSAALKAAGVKRVVPIKMPVASHTPYMMPASARLAERLANVPVQEPQIPVISNTLKAPFTVSNLKETLVKQLTHPTYFTDCLNSLNVDELDCLIEVGPGKALSGFAKKTLKKAELPIFNVDRVENLNKLREFLVTKQAKEPVI
ncbi:ACP S-malonyltransferase [Pediococcus acidilactici]|uniref:Malonyl CoA-acyl carrier protein transacylase n=1 Tax=Pediococcus acidilactici DSM 20284 TaxID=862514 RepID=E0NF33_PEDAC|nr:ACP S-malonyltransferase [Pediococcus acidilactici]AZP90574.1 ACP S-malonyltransferase [Pediococcus acidilactici]EFL96194.1 putative [acyl-carrier-protein] S-malonyltransferase [Pediococcus acidilactici DSM 20284]KRN17115.1 malonyl-CoA-[acyl-carrier-protein] transacylase [Pediococcus acidilactici]MBM6602872.1 ACP S-malonyltransferase [Pediococcus acidilactici]MBM6643075.1 ACP S-malonyltransferase [Pediococcus acidilactici]